MTAAVVLADLSRGGYGFVRNRELAVCPVYASTPAVLVACLAPLVCSVRGPCGRATCAVTTVEGASIAAG